MPATSSTISTNKTSKQQNHGFDFDDVLLENDIAEKAAPYSYRNFSLQDFYNMRSLLSSLFKDVDNGLAEGFVPATEKREVKAVLEMLVRSSYVNPETIEVMLRSLSSPLIELVLAKRAAVLNTKHLLINLIKNFKDPEIQQNWKAMLEAIVEQHGLLSHDFPNVPTFGELLSESVLVNYQHEMSFIQYIQFCGAVDLIPELSSFGMPDSNEDVFWIDFDSADTPSPTPPSAQTVSTATSSSALNRPGTVADSATAEQTQDNGSRLSRARPRQRSIRMQNSHAMLAGFNLHQSASNSRLGFRDPRVRGNDETVSTSAVTKTQRPKRVTPPGGHSKLMKAIRSGKSKLVKTLCAKMTIVDLNRADSEGETPIYAALLLNKAKIIAPLVKAFISERAAMNVINPNGKSIFAKNATKPDSLAQRLLTAVTADMATYHCGDALTFQDMIPYAADKEEILSRKALNRDSLGANSIQPGMGGFTRKQIKIAAGLIDSSRSAVCTTFALSTADKLLFLFPNDRVEIIAHNGGRGSHVYVMMNRKGNELDKFDSSPEFTSGSSKAIKKLKVLMKAEMRNALIVDPWLGSIGYPSVLDLDNYLDWGLFNFILRRERHFDSRGPKQLRQRP